MSTPLSQFPKPGAQQYQGQRKLYLIPIFMMAPNAPGEVQKLLERYWTDVRDHVQSLEISLGTVSHVYHETIFIGNDQGLKILEDLNPKGCSFIQAMCSTNAKLEATEDITLVQESSDWQRIISIGLMSQKVLQTAMEESRESNKKRYQYIGSQIDQTLKENESGALFVREDHQIQFPSDISVFYVAPPSLDVLKRWISDQLRAANQPPIPSEATVETPEETENTTEAHQSDVASAEEQQEPSEEESPETHEELDETLQSDETDEIEKE